MAEKKAKEKPTVRNTLYCSFCEKSQHDVRKLVAGPTVFICDECAELVVDIIYKDPVGPKIYPSENGRNIIVVRVSLSEKMDPYELITLPGLVQSVGEAFPNCTVALTNVMSVQGGDVITLEIDGSPEYDPQKLAQQVKELTVALHIERQKLIAEVDHRVRLEDQLNKIREDLFPAAIEALKARGSYPNTIIKVMAVLFLDVSGFSTMSEDERTRSVDMLRSLGRVIINSEQGMYINTWGDAIVAAFEEPREALRCGCKFVQHFGLAGMDARVGVAWGAIRISTNEIRQAHDIDGAAVNLGARLEAAADLGAVVCSPEFPQLIGEDGKDFTFSAKKIQLRKAVAELPAGAELDVFEVRLRPNK